MIIDCLFIIGAENSDQRSDLGDNFGESGIVEFQKEKSQGKGMESLIPSKRRKE
jgi:hypothetical protein